METLWQDLRYGIRMLTKNPGFTFIAVLALALGIGANTAIFSIVNAVLLRPLPFKQPERLVMIWEKELSGKEDRGSVAAANFIEWSERTQVFERLAAYHGQSLNLTGVNEPERIAGVRVSASIFPLLGVAAAQGRTFSPEEEQAGQRVVLISYGLWQRRFGGDAAVVGKTITLNHNLCTVIGVMPPDFALPLNANAEVWMPVAFDPDPKMRRQRHYLKTMARLKDGVSIQQAQAAMDTLARGLQQSDPAEHRGIAANLFLLHEEMVGDVRLALLVFFGAVSFILLIACANVANLMLARATARQKETAIRAALGASRGRLIQQMLTESVLLSVLGGVAGLLLAWWSANALATLARGLLPRMKDTGLDLRVLGFTCAVSLLTGLLFGLIPALQASKPDLNETLKDARVAGSRRNRARSLLVVVEVALSLVLLTGAGLLLKSFLRLQAVGPGFDPKNVLTLQINLPKEQYPDAVQIAAFQDQVLQRVTALPGVAVAGVINFLPLGGSYGGFGYVVDSPVAGSDSVTLSSLLVSSDYFRALGIPLKQGRAFTAQDVDGAPRVAIVNEAMARRYWPDQSPLGQRIKWGGRQTASEWMTVVGVVGDVHERGLEEKEPFALYVPHAQFGEPIPVGGGLTLRGIRADDARSFGLVIRANSDPRPLIAAVRSAVWSVDKNQPITRLRTMEQALGDSMAVPRFRAWLLAIFAGVALLLAAAGLYGVISYAVSQRTHEIGVRMALGAQQSDVLKLVVGQGMLLALIGVAIGLAASFALTRVLSNFLFSVKASDPMTFVVVSLLLTGVALLACYIPARRASKVDPMEALRYE